MNRIMKIQRIFPTANLDTVKDGRGGIFTFIPKDPIVEFNYNFIKEGKIRGNHYHPEFDEYFLLTEGEGVLVTREEESSEQEFIYLSKGHCAYTPKGTMHVFLAITDCIAVAMLTKKWDDCKDPIIHVNVGMGKGENMPISKSEKSQHGF